MNINKVAIKTVGFYNDGANTVERSTGLKLETIVGFNAWAAVLCRQRWLEPARKRTASTNNDRSARSDGPMEIMVAAFPRAVQRPVRVGVGRSSSICDADSRLKTDANAPPIKISNRLANYAVFIPPFLHLSV